MNGCTIMAALTSGRPVYWRWKDKSPCSWIKSWPVVLQYDLARMGNYNGDPQGAVVSICEIEVLEPAPKEEPDGNA